MAVPCGIRTSSYALSENEIKSRVFNQILNVINQRHLHFIGMVMQHFRSILKHGGEMSYSLKLTATKKKSIA